MQKYHKKKESILLGRYTVSLGNLILTFQGNVVPLYSSMYMPRRWRHLIHLNIQNLYPVIQQPNPEQYNCNTHLLKTGKLEYCKNSWLNSRNSDKTVCYNG